MDYRWLNESDSVQRIDRDRHDAVDLIGRNGERRGEEQRIGNRWARSCGVHPHAALDTRVNSIDRAHTSEFHANHQSPTAYLAHSLMIAKSRPQR